MAIEESSSTSSLELRLPEMRAQRPGARDLSSGTDMRKLRNFVPDYFRLMHRLIVAVFLENREIFHAQRKDKEAHANQAEGDHQLGPLGHEVMAGPGFEAGDADVEAVGDETQQTADGSEIESLGRAAYFLET